jgi:hypothetical protein
MHPYITESHDVKYAGSITSAYAIDTISSCVIVFHHHHHFIGEDYFLENPSIDGYKVMGFDVTQLTHDVEQGGFTIKTVMPIPMLVYGDSFQWEKYGHHIHPPSLDLTSLKKASLHQFFWESLIQFLRTDLDGNLSSTLNPLTASKLDHYLSRLFEGLSETANKGKFFDQHLLSEQSKDHFIDEIVDIALFATQIPQSMFTNLFHQRFEKHPMLESTLEVLQQFYVQVET